jgi:hypothetical protein
MSEKTVGQVGYEKFTASLNYRTTPWEQLPYTEKIRWELKVNTAAEVISESHILFACEVVELARKYEMAGISMSFRKSYNSKLPTHEVMMEWSPGRHECECYIRFTCNFREHVVERG